MLLSALSPLAFVSPLIISATHRDTELSLSLFPEGVAPLPLIFIGLALNLQKPQLQHAYYAFCLICHFLIVHILFVFKDHR